MECAGDSNKSATGIAKNLAELWNYQSPRLQRGGVSWQPSIILRTVCWY